MKFTLTYDGKLPASANSSKGEDVWRIRREMHPQLEVLCSVNPVLRDAIANTVVPESGPFGMLDAHHSQPTPPRDKRIISAGPKGPRRDLYARIIKGGKNFLPIVRESMALTCTLDILFLRQEEPGRLIMQGGDIDGRIKTRFDALTMPQFDDGVARYGDAGTLPDPLYCLMENDTLVTGCNIETGRLLTKPDGHAAEAHLVINVDVRVVRAKPYNMSFLGD